MTTYTPLALAGLTPHFTIRVWGRPDSFQDRIAQLIGGPRTRVPIAEIEVDTTVPSNGDLYIGGHRGLDFIPQKMLMP